MKKRLLILCFLLLYLVNFVSAESFGFVGGDYVVGPYSRVYEVQRDLSVEGSDSASAIKSYISDHSKDADFEDVFKRVNKTEECTYLRSVSQNYEFNFNEGDTPWFSKSFWESYFYLDPCLLDSTLTGIKKAGNWTINQTTIKIGWMFGANTFGGESKVFPVFIIFPFKIGSEYLLGDVLESMGIDYFLPNIISIFLFISIFVISCYVLGILTWFSFLGGKKGFLKTSFYGFLIMSVLPGFVWLWFSTKNGLFALLCLIFLIAMVEGRALYVKRGRVGGYLSKNPFMLIKYLFTGNYKIVGVSAPYGTRGATYSKDVLSSLERILYLSELIFFIVYPLLGAIPVLNVILSFLTLEVLFAPLFWRALLVTFILFFVVQIWPMYSNYLKRQNKYKEAVEEVLAKETMKAMARA